MGKGHGKNKGAERAAPAKSDLPGKTATDDRSDADAGANDKSDASSPYTKAEIGELLYMLEEEKLAGDLYEAFYAQTGAKVFRNIARSRRTAISARC